jgi:hypothetical protein
MLAYGIATSTASTTRVEDTPHYRYATCQVKATPVVIIEVGRGVERNA